MVCGSRSCALPLYYTFDDINVAHLLSATLRVFTPQKMANKRHKGVLEERVSFTSTSLRTDNRDNNKGISETIFSSRYLINKSFGIPGTPAKEVQLRLYTGEPILLVQDAVSSLSLRCFPCCVKRNGLGNFFMLPYILLSLQSCWKEGANLRC